MGLYIIIYQKTKNKKIIKEKEQQKAISLDSDNFNNNSIRSISNYKEWNTQNGEGVTLNRSFPNNFVSEFDPFLLLDEIGPMDIKPGKTKWIS